MNSLFTRIAIIIAFVTVGFGANAQSISSDLNNRPGVTVAVEEDFQVVYSGVTATTVRLKIELTTPAQAPNINLSLFALGSYTPLAFNGSGVSESIGAPVSFFPSPLSLKVTFDAPGTYGYTITIINDATDAVIATSSESVVVTGIAPVISSDLDGQTVLTDAETEYEISTVANDYAGATVKVFFKAQNIAQVPNYSLEFFETSTSSWMPLTLTANGTLDFGGPGFPLADASTQFRVTFDAPGVYAYKISLYEVGSNDTLATAEESVTVVDYIDPTIESSLDGMTVNIGAETPYQVTTTHGSEAGTLVRGFFKLNDVAQTADVNVSFETAPGVFTALPLNANGAVAFGAPAGFPLADASSNFKVTFDAVGVYGYKLYLYEVSSNDTLATSTESVTVIDPTPVVPEISSDLDGRAGVLINEEEDFTVTTVKNNAPNANVRIKITLDTPAQADNISLSFNNPVSSSFEQLTFDTSGVAYAGAPAGFALANADYDFKVTFIDGGTYGYNLALVNVAGSTTLANNDEEVVVIDNSSINENTSFISNAFPNPTTGIVNIQTTESSAGTLSVFTVTGKKVINQNINGSLHTVSMETLAAGMYIIKVSQNGKDAVIRVVKK